jgi:galactose mutarotase-like enzyme
VCEHVDKTRLACSVRCVRTPLHVRREIELDGDGARIDTRVTNEGGHAVPYSWGFHPCFDRATFAGGRIELEADTAHVPAPPFDPAHARLPAGTRFTWPQIDEPKLDVAAIPAAPTGSQDHVAVTPRSGTLRVTAPRHGLVLTLDYDLEAFPYLLLWQDFGSRSGWPLWGCGDVFALEPSTNPGRGAEDAGPALRHLDADATVATSVRVRWHRGDGTHEGVVR